ncbi:MULTISPECIES: SDR family NAD(P)-dependent oxidoreductase [unclassified Iodidimonas]|jgi:NAD(P)-dependent dehydrogenase (short-subunit alcohol dehydrogenase family)|uniref:SDR family NAD(P)-dependent oxidoreductase n=1 Tax=unclassified Iodidimonas TaxID=2626145 RepID=UPI002482AD83|nr:MULTISPECIES: SDR family NAD(P)-dependent oxidoreductase [unclassified Iodidimonas]
MALLKDRIAVVTGASRGIGYAVAKALAAQGAHIVALARPRSVGALEELDDDIRAMGGSVTLTPLDLTDYDGIDRLGAALYERWGKLDILVGNAGLLGSLSPLGHLAPKEWDEVMAVNVTANWRLIRSLDPLLRQSDAGRALFVTSGAAHKAVPYWGLYATTKAALEKMVEIYAAECAKTAVRVNLIDPGPIRTGMRAKAFPGEDPETLAKPADIAPLFLEMLRPDYQENGGMVHFKEWKTRPRQKA